MLTLDDPPTARRKRPSRTEEGCYLPPDLDCEDNPLPIAPTRALPGSEAKMIVMRERAGRGERLFHPEDAR